MSDFGDEVGMQILQGIRGARYTSRAIQFLYNRCRKNKEAEGVVQSDFDNGAANKEEVVQLDFNTPSDAQGFVAYCKEYGVVAEATQASVVMYASDIDKLPIADEIKEKTKESKAEQKKEKSKTKEKRKKSGRGKDGAATERQMEFVSALHEKGILSDSEVASLGSSPSKFEVNALLNRHQREAGFINMAGSQKGARTTCSNHKKQSFLHEEGSKCIKASKQLHEYKRDTARAKSIKQRKVIHRKIPTR